METQNMDEETKQKYEINKMFNLAEKVIMEYFCYYLDKKPDELFGKSDDINMNTEELILYPIEEYKSDQYLCFKLEIVQHDYKNCIPDELKNNPFIIETLKFLEHSVREVFNSVLHHGILRSIIQDVIDASFHLEFDSSNFSFKPVYIYPIRRQTDVLTVCKNNLEKFYSDHQINDTWNDTESNIKLQWEEQYAYVTKLLENMSYDKEVAKCEEEKNNTNIENYFRIGVVFRESSSPII